MECGEVAGIDACDNRLGGCITESGCHNGKLAEIVSFADFNECLNAELLRALCHLYELGVVEDAGDEQYGIGTAAVCDVNFVFE